jgi:ribosomal protein L16 Arg81 hydroxylase
MIPILNHRLEIQETKISELALIIDSLKSNQLQKELEFKETIRKLSDENQMVSSALTVQKQQIAQLMDDQSKLLRDYASKSDVDQLRKLLFEMQSSMFAHSSKVLDVLVQKSSTANP